MTGVGPDAPPPPPPPPPPPYAPPGSPGPAAYPATPARPTNGFAIASLVCSLVACGIGSVLAIIFGHVARGQIRRTHEGGGGLALAGLIIGYVGCAFIIAVIATMAFVGSRNISTNLARDNAREFEQRAVDYARFARTSPRDAASVARALDTGCCPGDVTLGATSVAAVGATTAELERVGWRLQFQAAGFDTGYACLTLPDVLVAADGDVQSGRCPSTNPSGV